MVTLPSAPGPQSQPEPHRIREVAESFGSDPERYDRTRPRYPDAMVEAIVAASPGRDLLDVGIGTGIAARQFRAAGCRVLGVEADARMADFARRDGFDVEVSTFETWDSAGRTFDAVIAGQTWHWVEPHAGAAKAAEVLRPRGRLALFWNVLQPPADVAEAFSAVYRRVLPGPIADAMARPPLETYSVMFDKAAEGIVRAGGFDDPEQWRYGWERTYDRDELLDQLPTHGVCTTLAPSRLEELLAGIGAAVDSAGGSVGVHYTCVVISAQLNT